MNGRVYLVLKAPKFGASSAEAGLHLISNADAPRSPHMLQATPHVLVLFTSLVVYCISI